jgi:hypothetical protein
MNLLRRSLPGFGAALLLTGTAAAQSASFIMLERHDCPWCKRWLAEIGERAWNQSNLGRRAPLRRVDTARGLPEDLRHLRDWRVTPSFILLADNHEIGRITGYQGDLFFWQQAEMLIARLPS